MLYLTCDAGGMIFTKKYKDLHIVALEEIEVKLGDPVIFGSYVINGACIV
jgi:hypothetical protein